MADKSTKEIALADVMPGLSGTAESVVVTRLFQLEFPWPSQENCTLRFQVRSQTAGGAVAGEDLVYSFGSRPREAIPPEAEADENGTVIANVGDEQCALPSWTDAQSLPLPNGPITVKTIGELFAAAKATVYQMMRQLDPIRFTSQLDE